MISIERDCYGYVKYRVRTILGMATIRMAQDSDIQAITDIYNQAVSAGGSTADLQPRTIEQRLEWVHSHTPREQYPVMVMEENHQVVAFGSLSRFHPRSGYDGVVELSYYVDESARGHGIATEMVQWLLDEAKHRGHRMATALIFADNAGSIALMEHYGFSRFGLLPRACYDGSRFLDMSYWCKEL
ncbi:phosphinothricin N-acetyltransferase [Bifidobacterium tsurumiense]|uniref:Phosphinothricin N-acetyltransferase n=2 Tax=Bifidobacterium tsurumiense TaxID=356829 RepID=A0A087EFH0_9BIFI|nr:phosphinothricin N-acetyltransferase [Bifidobacterium tsurumiense]